jgi:hypothetical protein
MGGLLADLRHTKCMYVSGAKRQRCDVIDGAPAVFNTKVSNLERSDDATEMCDWD